MMNPRVVLPKQLSRDGQIVRIVRELRALPLEKAWRVEWVEHKPTRSDAQNRYWWAVPVKLLSDATGYEAEEVHEFLLGTHFGWKDHKVPKTPRNPEGLASVPIRTTTRDADGRRSTLTKAEFADLVAFVQRFGAKRGVHIPDPDPNYLGLTYLTPTEGKG